VQESAQGDGKETVMKVKSILWPTDFSENAAKALPYVNSLSERYGAEVHVLYVLEEMGPFGAWYGEFDPSQAEALLTLQKEKAEAHLQQICENHLERCPLYVRHTAAGDPASEILKLIEKEKPDMVVMSSRGKKARFSFGSVAEKVVRHSPVPVIMVPG
jgi:nucleotide-binding universal stress UspA family protein